MTTDYDETQEEQAADTTRRARRGRGCAGIFFAIMMVVGLGWGAALGYFASVLEDAKAQIKALEDFRPKVGSKVYSADGYLLGEFTTQARQVLPLNEIPLRLQKAFIAAEDHKFYQHKGVRLDSIASAALYILRTGQLRGGSTITQQLARNVDPIPVGTEQTLRRKLREAQIALQLEREFTKDEILELYLNQIFLGISAYGVEAASQQYFGKSSIDLTLSEMALLAGLAPAPNAYQPIDNPRQARVRRDYVLRRMLENGFITEAECAQALAAQVDDSVLTREEQMQRLAEGRGGWRPNRFFAPYFAEEVRKYVLNQVGAVANVDREAWFENGFEIRTTLDMRLQRAAEEALLTALDEFDERKLEQLRRAGREEEFEPVTGALVCIDNTPGNEGAVRALIGGRDFETSKFNTATQARRQPGSSIKPFVWAAGIASGMTPSDIIYDTPTVWYTRYGQPWAPGNFDGRFSGGVTLRTALERSINIVSVKIAERTGMPAIRSYWERAGNTTPVDDVVWLTIALGTPVVTVLDQTVAYSTFANGGVRHNPFMVTEIRDRDGNPTYITERESDRAMPENLAYVMSYLMEGVCTYGTGARTARLERPRAGKTGTSNDFRDAWFCGYTPNYTTVIWIGYRSNKSLGSSRELAGGALASPIWTDFMIKAHEGLPIQRFEPPERGVVFHNIDKATGYAGGSFREAYLEGTGPRSRPVIEPEDFVEPALERQLPDLSGPQSPVIQREPLPEL